MNPGGPFAYFVLRPLSDLFLWSWRLERRMEFLYRPQFDRWLRSPLFSLLQALQNVLRRNDERLGLAEEKPLRDEERYSTVPFLLGEGRAVQYSLVPRSRPRTRFPAHPGENHLRDAMVRTLATGDWEMDFMVQVQTDPHRMRVEDATVKWPGRLSPHVPVATLRLPAQRFDGDAQLACADVLRYDPWHSLPEHRPLGDSNRARRRMYEELAELRQSMNAVPHVEPDGSETFPDGDRAPRPPRRPAASSVPVANQS